MAPPEDQSVSVADTVDPDNMPALGCKKWNKSSKLENVHQSCHLLLSHDVIRDKESRLSAKLSGLCKVVFHGF
jgi:hypothetical protein